MGHRLEKGLQAASHPESGQFLKYFCMNVCFMYSLVRACGLQATGLDA